MRLKPGLYPGFRIQDVRVKDGHFGVRFIVSGTVVADPIARPGEEPTPKGAGGTWTTQIDGKWGPTIGLGEVKAFLLACGLDGDLESQIASVLAGKLAGHVVSTDAYAATTKGNQAITKHTWLPADPAVIAAAGGVQDASFAEDEDAPSAPSAPAAPPAPPATPSTTLEQRAAVGGWWPNPNAAGWYYNAAGEQKPTAEIGGMFPG
jgi:hypothetical protein